jgi:hypothetical protein
MLNSIINQGMFSKLKFPRTKPIPVIDFTSENLFFLMKPIIAHIGICSWGFSFPSGFAERGVLVYHRSVLVSALGFPDFCLYWVKIFIWHSIGGFQIRSQLRFPDLLFDWITPFDELQETVFRTFLCTGWKYSAEIWYITCLGYLQIKFEFRYAWPTFDWIMSFYELNKSLSILCVAERYSTGFVLDSSRSSLSFVMFDLMVYCRISAVFSELDEDSFFGCCSPLVYVIFVSWRTFEDQSL